MRNLKLAETRIGRMQLHFLTYLRDHKFRFHFQGIMREVMRTMVKQIKVYEK